LSNPSRVLLSLPNSHNKKAPGGAVLLWLLTLDEFRTNFLEINNMMREIFNSKSNIAVLQNL
jgi:hypothetical protein